MDTEPPVRNFTVTKTNDIGGSDSAATAFQGYLCELAVKPPNLPRPKHAKYQRALPLPPRPNAPSGYKWVEVGPDYTPPVYIPKQIKLTCIRGGNTMDCLYASTDPRQPLTWVRHYLNGDFYPGNENADKSTFKTYGGPGYWRDEDNSGFNWDGNGPGFDFGPEPSP